VMSWFPLLEISSIVVLSNVLADVVPPDNIPVVDSVDRVGAEPVVPVVPVLPVVPVVPVDPVVGGGHSVLLTLTSSK